MKIIVIALVYAQFGIGWAAAAFLMALFSAYVDFQNAEESKSLEKFQELGDLLQKILTEIATEIEAVKAKK